MLGWFCLHLVKGDNFEQLFSERGSLLYLVCLGGGGGGGGGGCMYMSGGMSHWFAYISSRLILKGIDRKGIDPERIYSSAGRGGVSAQPQYEGRLSLQRWLNMFYVHESWQSYICRQAPCRCIQCYMYSIKIITCLALQANMGIHAWRSALSRN